MVDNLSDQLFQSDLLSQALPVLPITQIDLNTPPTSGQDYLTRVRLEAKTNTVVVATELDLKKYENNRTPQFISEEMLSNNVEQNFKPSKDWQNLKCLEFSQLRDRTRKEKSNFVRNNKIADKKSLIGFPLSSLFSENRKDWQVFCLGEKTAKSTSKKGHEPTLTILYNLDQTTVVNLFEILVEWTNEYGYSRLAFEWMFSLMCFLEKPLVPETHSSLRNLCRNCINMRSKLANQLDSQEVVDVAELNLFITIIGRYFQQYDLADN